MSRSYQMDHARPARVKTHTITISVEEKTVMRIGIITLLVTVLHFSAMASTPWTADPVAMEATEHEQTAAPFADHRM